MLSLVAAVMLLAAPPEALSAGQRLFNDGKVRDALGLFERAALQAPSSAEAWYWVAAANFEVGRTRKAAAAAEKALQLDPENGLAWILAGSIAQDRRDYATARERYLRYLQDHPAGAQADEVRVVLAQLP